MSGNGVEIRNEGDAYLFLWHEIGLGVGVGQIRESSDGLHAEISVQSLEPTANGRTGHVHWAKLNLSATRSRNELAKVLGERTRINGWADRLEYVCVKTAQLYREGEPFIDLATLPRVGKVEYLIDRLLPVNVTSAIYAHGGRGKGWLALGIALCARAGITLPGGLRPNKQVNVMYLDWETNRDEINRRLHMVAQGMGLKQVPSLIYREMSRPIADEAARVRAEIVRQNVGLVIVDSIAPAVGGDPNNADLAIRAMNALRSFAPATRLILAHMTKASKESNQPGSIIGTVMYENLARSAWELRSDHSNGEMAMALFHRKVNSGREQHPVGLRAVFDDNDNWIRFEAHDIEDSPELAAHASLPYRILAALNEGKKTVETLADETGAPKPTIRKMLSQLSKEGKVIQLSDRAGRGQGQAGLWGRAEIPF